MQKTNFPVEVIIHDDASTDHTIDIIREYYEKRPDLFHVIIERENQYSKKKQMNVSKSLYELAQGKYIALCEGDDYWTDPLKLQKQFDFMESNPEYAGCFHNYYKRIGSQIKNNPSPYKENINVSIKMAIVDGVGQSFRVVTIFFLKEAIHEFSKFRERCSVGDYPLKLCVAMHGNWYYMNETMSVYRLYAQGSWTKNNCNNQHAIKHCNSMIAWFDSLAAMYPSLKEEFYQAKGQSQLGLYMIENRRREVFANKYCRKALFSGSFVFVSRKLMWLLCPPLYYILLQAREFVLKKLT
jgi:glycosyltransferase involved in cell wall biosynthesis